MTNRGPARIEFVGGADPQPPAAEDSREETSVDSSASANRP